jgi:hypothetical protein
MYLTCVSRSIAVTTVLVAIGCGPRWSTFTAPENDFAISLPSQPDVSHEGWGDIAVGHTWRWYRARADLDVVNRRPSATFMVGVGAVSADDKTTDLIARVRTAIATNSDSAAVTNVEPIVHRGCHGEALQLRDKNNFTVLARLLSCDERVFVLIVMGLSSTTMDEQAKQFFESLTVLPTAH